MSISTPPPPPMSTSTTPKPIPSSTPTGGSQQSLSSSPSQHLHGLLLPQQQHHSHHHHHHQQTISSLLSQAAAFNTTPSMGGPPQSVSTGLSINTMSSGPPGPSGAFSSSSSQQPKIHSPATPQSNGGNGGYTSSETWSSVVHSLMCHLQSSDNEQFAKRAIESLAKKLKDKPDEMDALMNAVQKKGTVPTKCITIPRTLDGRLQVAGRKGFPHVIYARLWRWPDLHKNELKHLPICAYPFDLKLDNVCVNPYHYQRVISPGFDLAGLTLSGGRSFNGQFGNGPMSPSKLDSSVGSNNGDSVSIKHEPGSSSSSHLDSGKSSNSMNGSSSGSQSGSNSNFVPQLPFGNLYIQTKNLSTEDPGQSVHQHPHQQQQHLHSSQSSFYPPPAPGSSNAGNGGSFQPAQSVVAAVLPQTSNASNIVLYPINQASIDANTANTSASTTQPRPPGRLTQEWQGSYPPSFSNQVTSSGGPYSTSTNQNSDLWLQEEFPEIDLTTPPSDYWCTVTYFEGDLQIGDMFKVRSCYSSFIIDGFFDASREDRFCLGALTNVQRTSASEKARLHIGKGVQIENNMSTDGSVYVRALSEYSLFFESYYLDRESGREAFDAVHKIYPGSYVKVFSLKECLRCLKMATVQMQQQQKNNATNPNQDSGSSGGGSAAGLNVDDLRKLCRLRFSFVKGWGPDYMRKNILETPCWCEIQLNRPLQYLDQLINSLSRNTNLTSVFSD